MQDDWQRELRAAMETGPQPPHVDPFTGEWLCPCLMRRSNGTLLGPCNEPVSAEGDLCDHHRAVVDVEQEAL